MTLFRLWSVCGVCVLGLFACTSEAGPQRFVVPSGTNLTIPSGATGSADARCIDPHLDPPSSNDEYKFVGTGGDAVVSIGGTPEIPLAEAIKSGSVKVVGTDAAQGLSIRNLTAQQLSVRFRNNTAIAPDGAQGKELDALQKAFQDFDVAKASLEDGWRRRYLWELKERGFAGTTDPERIKNFQNENGLPGTSVIDKETGSAIDELLQQTEGFRSRDPALGPVLRITHNTFDETAPSYAIYDAGSGRPLLRANGTAWTTNRIDDIRELLKRESGKQPPLDSIILDGFDGDEVDGFRKTIDLGEMMMFGSKAYHATGAQLIEIGQVKEEAAGIFSAKVKIRSAEETVRVTFRSRIRQVVEAAVASVRKLFGGTSPTSVEAAVKAARKSAIQAGHKSEDLGMEYIDEAGCTEFVVVPIEKDSIARSEHEYNDAQRLAILGWSANDN